MCVLAVYIRAVCIQYTARKERESEERRRAACCGALAVGGIDRVHWPCAMAAAAVLSLDPTSALSVDGIERRRRQQKL